MVKIILNKSAKWTGRLTLLVLVMLALYVSLGRYYAPLLSNYRESLVATLSERSGLKFEIDEISGSWERYRPALHLQGLRILDEAGKPALSIGSLSLEPDMLASLRARQFRVAQLKIDSPVINLIEIENGVWQIAGIKSTLNAPKAPSDTDTDQSAAKPDKNARGAAARQANESETVPIADWLLTISRLHLANSQFQLHFNDGQLHKLPAASFDLYTKGSQRFLQAKINASDDASLLPGLGLQLSLHSVGDPRDPSSFSARAYGKVSDLNVFEITSLIEALQNVEINQLDANGEFWFEYQPGGKMSIQAKLNTPELAYGSKDLEVQDLSLDFKLESDGHEHWQFWLPGLSYQQNQITYTPAENVYVDWQAEKNIHVQVGTLRFEPLKNLLVASALLPKKVTRILSKLNPSGELNNIDALIPLQDPTQYVAEEPVPGWELSGDLHDIGVRAWHGIPAVSHLHGFLHARPKAGFVDLAVKEGFDLHFAKVYSDSMHWQEALGRVEWEIGEQWFYVFSNHLQIKGEAGEVTGAFFTELPKRKDEGTPQLDLRLGVRYSSAQYKNNFIPKVLDQGLHDWLDSSILGGNIHQAGFVYYGPIIKTDFHPAVQLQLDVAQVELQYSPDWPKISQAAGQVWVDNGLTEVDLEKGLIYDSKIERGRIEVVPMHLKGDENAKGLELSISGQVQGFTKDGIRVLQESPLREHLGDFIAGWQAEGNMSAKLDILLPLSGAEFAPETKARIYLLNSKLAIPDLRLDFAKLEGFLGYNDKQGLWSEDLRAEFWGHAAKAAINSDKTKSGWSTHITMRGVAEAQRLLQWTEQPALAFAEGETSFLANLDVIPGGDSALLIKSDLKGVSFDLPAPLNKPAEQTMPLEFRQPIAKDNFKTSLSVGKQFQVAWLQQQGAMERMEIVVGGNKPKLDKEKQITVHGKLSAFDFDAWLAVLNRYLKVQEGFAQHGFHEHQQPQAAPKAEPLKVVVEDFMLENAQAFSYSLDNIVANVNYNFDYWRVHVLAKAIEGYVDIFDDESPYRVRMDFIDLSYFVGDETPEQAQADASQDVVAEAAKKFNPGDMPAMDFAVKSLRRGDDDFGYWSFNLSPAENSVVASALLSQVKGLKITGKKTQPKTVRWSLENDKYYTEFNGEISAGDLGEVLEKWGYQRVINSEKAHFDANVKWQGDPSEFALEKLVGTMTMDLEKGNFINAPNTTSNALKVVGFLNFDRIVRRLRLDFSDLASSGLAFDRIEGVLHADAGVLSTPDPMSVKGASSEFQISGVVDLLDEKIDAEMVVTLPIGSNLPWVAAVAGGLPTAAGVYVVSKMLKKQVNRLSSAVYSVSGDWEQPEVKFERLFSDKLQGKEATAKSKSNKSSDGPGELPDSGKVKSNEATQPILPKSPGENSELKSSQQTIGDRNRHWRRSSNA